MIRWIGACATLAVVAVGCEDPTTPADDLAVTAADLPGSYAASVFTVAEGGSTDDLLAAGASVDVTLDPEGSTTGRLFIPDGDEDGSDFEADLAGSWRLSGSQVTFEHTADTFMRDMSFDAELGRLTGDATFGTARVHLVLDRQ